MTRFVVDCGVSADVVLTGTGSYDTEADVFNHRRNDRRLHLQLPTLG